MRIRFSVTIWLAFILVFPSLAAADSETAAALAGFLPDTIGMFTAQEPAKAEEIQDPSGIRYRIQRPYNSTQGHLGLVAISYGDAVEGTFPEGEHGTMAGYEAVMEPAQMNMVAATVRIKDNMHITLVVFNSEDPAMIETLLRGLDLAGLEAFEQ